MGGFQSKFSEASAMKTNNAMDAMIRSAGNEGAIVVADSNLDTFDEGIMKGLMAFTVFGGGAIALTTVTIRFICYEDAKKTLENSQYFIPLLQERIETRLQSRRRRGVAEAGQDDILVMELEKWERKREWAVAYMRKHRIIGKLVDMFAPKDDY